MLSGQYTVGCSGWFLGCYYTVVRVLFAAVKLLCFCWGVARVFHIVTRVIM